MRLSVLPLAQRRGRLVLVFVLMLMLVLVAAFLVGCLDGRSTGPTRAASARVVEAGWSFGFCLGPCRGELTISDGSLSYRISSRSGDEMLSSHRGALTTAGATRLDAATAALPEGLLERYGCPDCADGGAAYFVVQADSETRRVEYEYGSPPPELTGLDAFLKGVMEALAACGATGDVIPESGCEPLAR